MMRSLFIILALCFSISALASSPKTDNAKHVVQLLSQPMKRQILCAEKGYIGYQNSLSANYFSGIMGNKIDLVKAYAWSLAAYYQVKKTGNKKLILGQRKTVNFVAKKMTAAQIKEAKSLFSIIVKKYGHAWPAYSTYSKLKDFPAPCNLQ